MKKALIIFALSCFHSAMIAQPGFQWAQRGASNTNEYANAVVTDNDGNTYVTGNYSTGGIVFGNDTLPGNGANFYLVKYNTNGDVLWARSASGPGGETGYGVDVDAQGNVYVCGSFSNAGLTFGSFVLNNNGPSPTNDIFVVKYDSSGNVLNAFRVGGTANDYAFGIRIDASGYCFLVGSFFSPSINFGLTTLTNTNTISDVYVARFDPVGNLLWVQTAQDASGLAIDISDNSEAYFTGGFIGQSIAFGNDTLSTAGNNDFYVAKLDATGSYMWARIAGGFGDDSGDGVGVDADGNCYVTGYYTSTTITFGTVQLFNSGGGFDSDVFVVKYSPSGNVLWARRAGFTTQDAATGIRVDDNGNAYVSGFFSSQPFVLGGISLNPVGGDDAFVAKYDSSGTEIWGISAGGASNDEASALGIDGNGDVYLGGTFSIPSASFGSIVLTNVGARDVFLAKIDVSLSVPEINHSYGGVTYFPIPASNTINISSNYLLNKVRLQSLTGQIILESSPEQFETQLDISNLAPGIYFVQTETTKGNSVGKIVKSE